MTEMPGEPSSLARRHCTPLLPKTSALQGSAPNGSYSGKSSSCSHPRAQPWMRLWAPPAPAFPLTCLDPKRLRASLSSPSPTRLSRGRGLSGQREWGAFAASGELGEVGTAGPKGPLMILWPLQTAGTALPYWCSGGAQEQPAGKSAAGINRTAPVLSPEV